MVGYAALHGRRITIDHHDDYLDELGDYDTQINQSWREFIDDLAARLGDLNPGTFEFIELSHPMNGRDHLLIAYRVTRSRRMRAVVPKDSLAVGYSSTDHPSPDDREWRYLPRKEEYVYEFGRKQLFRAATQSIALLRRHWWVIHPSFLTLRDPCSTVHPFAIYD